MRRPVVVTGVTLAAFALVGGTVYGYRSHRTIAVSAPAADSALVAAVVGPVPVEVGGDTALSPARPRPPASRPSATAMSPRREVQPLREEIVATPAPAVSEAPRATLLAAGVLLDLRVQGRQCEAALEPHGLLPAAVVGGATLPGSGTIVLRIVGRTLNGDALTSVRVRAEKLVVADDVYTVTGGEAELPVRQFARGSAASNVATGAVAGAVLGAILSHGKLKGTLAGAAAGAAVGGVVTTAARESCLADGTPLTVRLSAPALATDR